MYEIEYMLDGARVGSFRHPGPLDAARTFAEDAVKRHKAHFARVIERRTNVAETWPAEKPCEPLRTERTE